MLANAQEAVERLLIKLQKTKINQDETEKSARKKTNLNIVKPIAKIPVEDYQAILDRILASPKFKALAEGDWSAYNGDWSSVDMALMCRLAVECKCDPEAMEAIFNMSLMAERDKWWKREDYRKRTIQNAIAFISTHYDFSDELPEIVITNRPTQNIASDALNSLIMQNDLHPTLFISGNTLVRLQTPSNGSVFTEAVTPDILKHGLNRSAQWVKVSKGDGLKSPTDCPEKIVKDILAYPQLPFPELKGIAQLPLFLPNGELFSLPGYHPDLGYYLDLGDLTDEETSLATVTPDDVARAVSYLDLELLSDFPFEDQFSKANAFALLLLPFVRHLIQGHTPLHVIDASTFGSGKTILANIITLIAMGQIVPPTGEAQTREEWPKLLLATLLKTPPFVFLDNLSRKLDSSALASMLTTEVYTDRLLGASKQVDVSTRCIWIATGNNTQVCPELTRRVVPIRLLPKQAHPHKRKNFRHPNLIHWVEQNRWQLVHACLVIVKYWFHQGKPSGQAIFNSYNDYAAVLGGILECAGVKGFLDNQTSFNAQADTETDQWEILVSLWWEKLGSTEVTAKELIFMSEVGEQLEAMIGYPYSQSSSLKLARLLQANRGRIFDDKQITIPGRNSSNTTLYALKQINPGDDRG